MDRTMVPSLHPEDIAGLRDLFRTFLSRFRAVVDAPDIYLAS